ncbi:MAG TPA: alkaline phosphatase family protein, partial [Polyangia bacterium]|nr:alkaline phosphatase family protein [Polyangia bacterium]
FFFLLDGARIDLFREYLQKGDMPNIARYMIEPGSFRAATTVFPSVTGVAYIPYLTGLFPGRANIPGYRWFDRDRYQRRPVSLMRFRNYHGLGSYLMDRDLAKHARTLFELLRPSSNIFSGISRGTGVRRNAAYFRRVPAALKFFRTGSWEHIDRAGEQYLLRAARRRRERFTFHTTYSIDEYSHHDGPFSERARACYLDFDRVIGRLVHELRATGQLDSSLLVMGADHGHTEVHEHFDLEGFIEKRGLKTLYFPKQVKRWLGADAAVMVAGNGMGHIYLKGPDKWTARPSADEHLERHPELVDELVNQPAVDHVIYRPDSSDVRVRSRRGEASVTLDGDRVTYRVHGADPFGYPPLPEVMTRAEALERTANTDYPDAPVQVAQVFESPRAGDFLVSSAPGYDLRARHNERIDYRSCHGTLHREHMTVPFAINHPIVERTPRSVDAFPTILNLLGRPVPYGLDGVDLVA